MFAKLKYENLWTFFNKKAPCKSMSQVLNTHEGTADYKRHTYHLSCREQGF